MAQSTDTERGMTLNQFMEKFADEIGGQYSDYDKSKSVIIVPLQQNRFQAVLGSEKRENGRTVVQFTSKVCLYSPNIDLKELLKNNINFYYSKFFIDEDIIRIIAVIPFTDLDHEIIKEMIMEVASAADEWENKLTGLDVN